MKMHILTSVIKSLCYSLYGGAWKWAVLNFKAISYGSVKLIMKL